MFLNHTSYISNAQYPQVSSSHHVGQHRDIFIITENPIGQCCQVLMTSARCVESSACGKDNMVDSVLGARDRARLRASLYGTLKT